MRSHVRRGVLGVLYVAATLLAVRGGFVPGYHEMHQPEGAVSSYPVTAVGVTCLAMFAELTAAAAALRASWGWLVVTTMLFEALFLAAGFFALHAPGWVIAHALWVLLLLAALLARLAARLWASLVRRREAQGA